MKNRYIDDLENGVAFVGFPKNKGPGSKTDLMFHARRMNEIIEHVGCKKAVELGTGRGQGCVLLSHSVSKDGTVYTVDKRTKNQGTVKRILGKYPSSVPVRTFHKKLSTGHEFVNSVMEDGEKVDVLFVDTLHSRQQVIDELNCWLPHLSDKCIIFFHDVIWCHDTVKVLIDDLLENFKTYKFCTNFNEEESQVSWSGLGIVGLSEGRPLIQSMNEIHDAPSYAKYRLVSKSDYHRDESGFNPAEHDFKYELIIDWPGMIILTKYQDVAWRDIISR